MKRVEGSCEKVLATVAERKEREEEKITKEAVGRERSRKSVGSIRELEEQE